MVAQTQSLAAVRTELKKRVGHIPGMNTPQVIRPIKGTSTWSQHSFRNADDLMVAGSAQDPIVSVLKQMRSEGYPVGTILDRNFNSDHADHIHVEGSPKIKGDPEKPSTWGSGAGQPNSPESKESAVTGEGSSSNWWDWILNPTETAAEELGGLIARVGWAVLALIVLIIAVIFMLNEFSKSETGSNLVELAATKGLSAAK